MTIGKRTSSPAILARHLPARQQGVVLFVALIVLVQWMRHDERQARRLDRHLGTTVGLAALVLLVLAGCGGNNGMPDSVTEQGQHTADIWNPATGAWTRGAAAQQARLYHSNAVLMPDASVLVMGGGAPGPQNNTNVEVYYPPYLFAAGSPRPT